MSNNGKFNPQNYLTKVKGKDYLEVKYRVHWFRTEHPDWDVKTEIVQLDLEKGISVIRADIYDEKGNHRASGIKMEYQKNFFDHTEKSETGAIGRALACLGYGTLQCFELEEGIEKERIADSPVSLTRDKGNGKTMSQTVKEQVQPPQEDKQEKGNNGGNGNGGTKASMRQVRYLKDLCKDLNIKPAIAIAGLSTEKASQFITDLEKMRTTGNRS